MLLDPNPWKRPERIETLIEVFAQPLMERITAHFVYRKSLQRGDADDIVATSTVRLLEKLQDRRATNDVEDFEKYVAALTYNVINDYMRRRFPERTRLRNRLRYIASTDDRLAIWNSPAGTAVGLAAFAGETPLEQVKLDGVSASALMLDRDRPADATVETLRVIGAPVTLRALTDVMVSLWGVREQEMVTQDVIDENPTPLEMLESRESIGTPWDEIFDLRTGHRDALKVADRESDREPLAELRADFDYELASLAKVGAARKLRRAFSGGPARIARAANARRRKL